jgi:YVTN family beta-propeller protein
MRRVALLLVFFCTIPTAGQAQITTAATFGTAISLPGGTPSDMVLDEFRQRLYLVNTNNNRIDIYSISTHQLIGNVGVGTLPLAAAMSMDGALLYVTNSKSSSISVIDLGQLRVTQTVSLPAVPEGVEVGVDGRALIGTLAANSLLIFDQTQTTGQQLTAVLTPPTPSTPAPLQPQTLTRPQTTFNSKMIRTPDGQFIIGLTNPGANGSQTYLFVYEVLSGTILRSRTVAGQSTVLSVSPDGARFMAGFTLYDTATLSVIAQQNNANAPFTFAAAFSTQQNVGGSVFTPDGNTIYSAFNVATFTGTNPPPKPLSSTLLINDSRNLGIQLGIRLPESIVAKMVITSDGANAWSLSQSGMIYLPLSTLYNYPIIQPDTTQVFLSANPCNRGLATGSLKVSNLGKGKLTYAINNLNQSLVTQVTSGVAPSSIQFTMDPGRANVNRQSGTNLYTGGQTVAGTPVDINLSSNEAINLPNTVHVYMNQRDPDQRGLIYPIPTLTNNSPASAANPTFTGGNEGLQDIVLDQGRNRVYISNSARNRIEIFDTVKRVFLDPIVVGQLPHQMALSTDGNTLYAGTQGGELISIVDLTQDPPAFTGYVNFPPLPRQANGTNAAVNFPRSLAYGLFGLEFIMSNGGQWKLSNGNVAIVRPQDSITRINNSSNLTEPTDMIASADGFSILTLAGNGEGFLYDATTDSYVSSASLIPTASLGASGYFGPVGAAPGGAYFLEGGQVLNSSLTPLLSSGNPTASATQRNVAAVYPLDQNTYVALTTSFRASINASSADEQRPTLQLNDVNSGQSTLLGVLAEQPRWTVFGTTRTNVPARSMVVDAGGTAYILTLSGLTVAPMTVNGAPTPVLNAVRPTTGTTLTPGAFVNIVGSGLADAETANTLPAPTVLGGSCVTFNDVSLPLLRTAAGAIQAQIPVNVLTGSNVVVVRSLATGQYSNSVVVNVSPAP